MAFWRPFEDHSEDKENVNPELTFAECLEFKNKDSVQCQRFIFIIYVCLKKEHEQNSGTNIIRRISEAT